MSTPRYKFYEGYTDLKELGKLINDDVEYDLKHFLVIGSESFYVTLPRYFAVVEKNDVTFNTKL